MPTLAQLAIQPELLQRLAGTKRIRIKDEEKSSDPSHSGIAPIRTPSALLARDPVELSLTLELPLSAVETLRANIAESVISDPFSSHAAYCNEIVDSVSKYCMDSKLVDTQDRQCVPFHSTLRPPSLIRGSVTALDFCAYAAFIKNVSHNKLDCIATGCNALDRLLAPDPQYASCENTFVLPYPFNIPKYDHSNHDQSIPNSVSNSGGIPFGMVTEFSGPPSSGKTQLALSIAVRAVVVHNLQVTYLISGGGGGNSRRAISRRLFSLCMEIARAQVALHKNLYHDAEKQSTEMAGKALERIIIASCPNGYSLLGTLARIEKNSFGHIDPMNSGMLLIIDSISGCIGHHLSESSSLVVGASIANQVALSLRRMTRTLDGQVDNNHFTAASQNGSDMQQSLCRRFAVILTNGSVAKRSTENERTTTPSSFPSNKPAMGRYWLVSDIGLWLEEFNPKGKQQLHLQDFYSDTSVPGLHLEKKVISASLQNHYGKSCTARVCSSQNKNEKVKPFVTFVIKSGGVADE